MEANETELLAGLILDDGGISLPLRTAGGRTVRVTMKAPTLRSLIRISRLYLQTGVTPEAYNGMTLDETAAFVAEHGKTISRIVAYGIVRGPVSGRILNRPVAWLLRSYMTPAALAAAWRQIMSCIVTTSFGTIIASAEAMNKLKPLASRNEGENEPRS